MMKVAQDIMRFHPHACLKCKRSWMHFDLSCQEKDQTICQDCGVCRAVAAFVPDLITSGVVVRIELTQNFSESG